MIVAFVVDTDRHVQRAFDWCVHAFMRATGARKCHVRLAINVAAASAIALGIMLRWKWYVSPIWFAALCAIWLAGAMLIVRVEWQQDREAELRGNMISRADRQKPGTDGDKMWGLIFAVWDVLVGPGAEQIAACGRLLAERGNLCIVGFWILTVAHSYLRKTPPVPPARRARVLSRVAPSGA